MGKLVCFDLVAGNGVDRLVHVVEKRVFGFERVEETVVLHYEFVVEGRLVLSLE